MRSLPQVYSRDMTYWYMCFLLWVGMGIGYAVHSLEVLLTPRVRQWVARRRNR